VITRTVREQLATKAAFVNRVRDIIGLDPLSYRPPRRPRLAASATLIGQTFGVFRVTGLHSKDDWGHRVWTCRCVRCDHTIRRNSSELRRYLVGRCRRCRSR
jgi:hypothetical protein